MTQNHDEIDVPRVALLGAAGIVIATIIAAAVGNYARVGRVEMPAAATLEARDIRFVAREDKGYDIYDAASDSLAGTVPDERAGFIRGVLRGLSRERRMNGAEEAAAYRLVRAEGGRLSLIDPETGRRIELRGFGATNFDAFERLMTLGRETT